MFRHLRNLFRLLQVARAAARWNVLFLFEDIGPIKLVAPFAWLICLKREKGRPGERLAGMLKELGPTFIKLGQTLSTRPDILGEDICADLAELQDRLPPFPAERAKAIIEEEMGAPIGTLFKTFTPEPVAAASIAQVHFATTAEGREVAVKVIRPGVEKAFKRDLDLMFWIAEIVERVQPRLRRLKPVESVRTFKESVDLEMDLRFEAAACAELAENLAGDDGVRIPEVEWQFTSRSVMTLERIHGIRVDRPDLIAEAGFDPRQIMKQAAESFFNQVFRDGFFHADMHPGNAFIDRRTGDIIMVDFGIMGRVDKATRRYLAEMLLGFLTGDYRRVAEVHFEAGYVPADQSIDAFTQAARSIAEPIMGRPLNEISIGRLLGQLFQVTEQFGMETQPQLLLLQKTMVQAEGLGRILTPDINMWVLAQPLVEEWMRANLGPEAKIREAAENTRSILDHLPRFLEHTQKAASQFNEQGLKLHPDTIRALKEDDKPRRQVPLAVLLPWVLAAVLLYLFLTK